MGGIWEKLGGGEGIDVRDAPRDARLRTRVFGVAWRGVACNSSSEFPHSPGSCDLATQQDWSLQSSGLSITSKSDVQINMAIVNWDFQSEESKFPECYTSTSMIIIIFSKSFFGGARVRTWGQSSNASPYKIITVIITISNHRIRQPNRYAMCPMAE